MSVHSHSQPCLGCENKLKDCDPRLAEWFHSVVKDFSDAHICWGYRGKEDQDQAFNAGKSKDAFPDSPHNHSVDLKPSSLALDLFQLLPDGSAQFNHCWYQSIYLGHVFGSETMKWGGTFRSLKDFDHFYLTA